MRPQSRGGGGETLLFSPIPFSRLPPFPITQRRQKRKGEGRKEALFILGGDGEVYLHHYHQRRRRSLSPPRTPPPSLLLSLTALPLFLLLLLSRPVSKLSLFAPSRREQPTEEDGTEVTKNITKLL